MFITSITLIMVCWLTGCSTINVNIDYERGELVEPIEPKAAKIKIGQFSDRRPHKPNWLGEVRSQYHFPKSIVATRQPVSTIVRDIILKAAEDRGMIGTRSEPPIYQLYGQIMKLDGMATDPAIIHAHLVIRLFDLENSRDVYVADHEITQADRTKPDSALRLGNYVEDALNDAVAASLDDPDLRALLVTAGAES